MNEYISREDVFKKAKSSILVPTDNEWDCGYNTAMAEMQGFIKQLPAADVQPVAYAEWIGFTRSAFLGCDYIGEPIFRDTTVWKCSHCGRNTVVRDNFCPNCGARMDGEQV